MQERQVFQTSSAGRWQRFKWASRVLLLLIPLAIAVVVSWFFTESFPTLPSMQRQSEAYKNVLGPDQHLLYKNSVLAKRYKGFRDAIDRGALKHRKDERSWHAGTLDTARPLAIRSAFYVTWSAGSFASLQHNIGKLNLVIPEWFFIDPSADTLTTAIDGRGLAVLKRSGVAIAPMLSNFSAADKRFHGESVHRILASPQKRSRLIADLVRLLHKNGFAGINVDLEELRENSDDNLIAFQKELYSKLHANHLLVTQDVIPFNEDYNDEALARYNDYLFVMAYDEFSRGTRAGPIAEQKWIEAAVDAAVRRLPPSKLVLGLAAYGYDWPQGGPADPDAVSVLTYQDALTQARESQARIDFDNDTYNLHYSYFDDDNRPHEVAFTDAATTFNAMRFAQDSRLAGVALWRLGSEDDRIWSFYNRNFVKDSISQFDFNAFANIRSSETVFYSGFGEVLDVLATPRKGTIVPEIDSASVLIAEENYDHLPSSFMAKKFGWNGSDTIRNRRQLVLSFDDGPDPTWTPKVLKILKEKGVPASFFLVGINAENNIPLVKRIYAEGHEIGNHTFTHPNIAEVSRRRAIVEMESTRLLIECITGHSTILFRAPYNADFTPEKTEELLPVALARTRNYLDVGESIDPLDWEPGVTADTIFQRIVTRKAEIERDERKYTGGNIILLHDAGGETRKATLEALPRLIDYFRRRGYTFTTVAGLLHKSRDEMMPPVPRGSGYYLIEANFALAEFWYWAGRVLFILFLTFIGLSIARTLAMGLLAVREKNREGGLAMALPVLDTYPLVSIIVPAYNEELNAVGALQNLLRTDYPNVEILFVDDGSTDETWTRVSEAFAGHALVKVYTKPNGGKASALNYGISLAGGDYLVCIDADTKLMPDAVSRLMMHFLVPRDSARPIGAVAGNVKVGNEVNMLTKWQAIEYISSQNFDRRAFAYLNAITVVPGAIGAFRKEAIATAGGFTTDTLAEDCDLTIRILRAGYTVTNDNAAMAYTEAPERLRQFLKQRFRWSFGVLQTFWKHKDLLFSRKQGWLGMLALPNILLFQYLIPAFVPLADLFMLAGLLTGNGGQLLPYYVAFILFDAALGVIAFRMERERMTRLVWLVPQRLVYRWLMWWVLFRSVRRAVRGELQHWGVLKRTGHVALTLE